MRRSWLLGPGVGAGFPHTAARIPARRLEDNRTGALIYKGKAPLTPLVGKSRGNANYVFPNRPRFGAGEKVRPSVFSLLFATHEFTASTLIHKPLPSTYFE